jgi:hypothetical protein
MLRLKLFSSLICPLPLEISSLQDLIESQFIKKHALYLRSVFNEILGKESDLLGSIAERELNKPKNPALATGLFEDCKRSCNC